MTPRVLRIGSPLPDIGLVVVLVPTTNSADPALAYYHEYDQSHAEFARAFDALGLPWRWQPVTTATCAAVLDALAVEPLPAPPVVFNLCDGDDSNDVPGIEVIHHLDRLGLAYTGADAAFYRGTTSKIWMKHAFQAAGVATPPWTVIADGACDAESILAELGAPLIVKPAISAGSMGITLASVVSSATALREQVARLHEGYRGWNLVSGGVFVERYIAGREFTTFIVGDARRPKRATIYPTVERDFHAALPPTERFLSYDRLWEVYEGEAPIGDGEHLWEYVAAPAAIDEAAQALSWAAYAAVGGRGYGRVDLRMDEATGALHVLEVNAQCGLSEDENYTSIGAILRLAGRPFAGLVQDIIVDALARRPAVRRSARA